MRLKIGIVLFLLFFAPSLEGVLLSKHSKSVCVIGGYRGGRLGNQMFQVATTLSVAFDHNAKAVFPEFAEWKDDDLPENMRQVFFRLDTHRAHKSAGTFREHDDFNFVPIPYKPNIRLLGYFQSERYFRHNKDKILPYFEPRSELSDYLKSKYADLLNHPNTVGMHLRAYNVENPYIVSKVMTPVTFDYFNKAASLFGNDALFVIFTDNVPWAKEILSRFDRPYLIIENENQYGDFYLLSYMKHQIISNSTFSWWAAYLNKNPHKIVIAPFPWFHTNSTVTHGNDNILPPEWYRINPFTLEVSQPR